jgi:CubicO group peptidase (beta-lactamase class C family)
LDHQLKHRKIRFLLAVNSLAQLALNEQRRPNYLLINTVLRQELLDPLGMKDSSYTAEAIEAAANHANGHHWKPEGTIEVPFTSIFPYHLGGAGDINSTVEDMARWIRLQLGNGTFEGRRIISPENLAVTRTPKVAVNDTSVLRPSLVYLPDADTQ